MAATQGSADPARHSRGVPRPRQPAIPARNRQPATTAVNSSTATRNMSWSRPSIRSAVVKPSGSGPPAGLGHRHGRGRSGTGALRGQPSTRLVPHATAPAAATLWLPAWRDGRREATVKMRGRVPVRKPADGLPALSAIAAAISPVQPSARRTGAAPGPTALQGCGANGRPAVHAW